MQKLKNIAVACITAAFPSTRDYFRGFPEEVSAAVNDIIHGYGDRKPKTEHLRNVLASFKRARPKQFDQYFADRLNSVQMLQNGVSYFAAWVQNSFVVDEFYAASGRNEILQHAIDFWWAQLPYDMSLCGIPERAHFAYIKMRAVAKWVRQIDPRRQEYAAIRREIPLHFKKIEWVGREFLGAPFNPIAI